VKVLTLDVPTDSDMDSSLLSSSTSCRASYSQVLIRYLKKKVGGLEMNLMLNGIKVVVTQNLRILNLVELPICLRAPNFSSFSFPKISEGTNTFSIDCFFYVCFLFMNMTATENAEVDHHRNLNGAGSLLMRVIWS
jgi:hypothetical protein